jgi:adenine/guanine phosphoribosyltransferase-like PRPP-binding protein
MLIGGSYLKHPFKSEFRDIIKLLIAELTPLRGSFKTIVVTGQSGMIPGGILAYELNKHLVTLRKQRESSHGSEVEGTFIAPWIVIDDFCSTGATLSRILMHPSFHDKVLPAFVSLYATEKLNRGTVMKDEDAYNLIKRPGYRTVYELSKQA